MSDNVTTDLALTRLREREAQLREDVREYEQSAMVSRAVLTEVSNTIELLERGGRKKPGRKAGAEAPFLTETAAAAAEPATVGEELL